MIAFLYLLCYNCIMKIVAIGGGEKTPAVLHALDLSGAEKPHVLINPSSASTHASYDRKVPVITSYFADLGVTTSVLHEYGKTPSSERITHELGRASLVYTLGGNSPYMLATMRRHGSDQALTHAVREGLVHAGTSAGALLPFELAHSNIARRPAEEAWDYAYLKTLGILPGVATAHADQHDPTPQGLREQSRLDALLATFPSSVDLGYAIDNHAAIAFSPDTSPRVLRARPDAQARVIRRSANGIDIETL